jgi:hypothetical protein
MSKIYIDNPCGGQQVIYGATSDGFKINWATAGYKKRRGSQAIQLGKAKPVMKTVLAAFTAAMEGTRVDPGEFVYVSPSKLLTITNVGECSGVSAYPTDSYAIPINYIPREDVSLSNVYQDPTEV